MTERLCLVLLCLSLWISHAGKVSCKCNCACSKVAPVGTADEYFDKMILMHFHKELHPVPVFLLIVYAVFWYNGVGGTYRWPSPPFLPNLVEKSDHRTHYKFSRCPNWGPSLQPFKFLQAALAAFSSSSGAVLRHFWTQLSCFPSLRWKTPTRLSSVSNWPWSFWPPIVVLHVMLWHVKTKLAVAQIFVAQLESRS